MKRFVLTRSRASDYQFVGDKPKERWWTRYDTVTHFERPSIVIKAPPNSEWCAYVTAMQSTRTDRIGTLIRYSLALEGGADDAEGLRRLVAEWLAPGGRSRLAAALDDQFKEDELERWLEPDGAADPEVVRERLEKFFESLKDTSDLDAGGEVVGGAVVRANDVKQFLQAITKISEGEHEVLLVSSSRDVAGLKMDGALLKPSWMAIDREGKKHHEKKNAGFIPEAGSADRPRPEPGINWNPWVIAGLLIALGLLVALVLTRTPPGESPPPPSRDARS